MERSCRNCKYLKNGMCNHPEMVMVDATTYEEAIIDHVEYAFDGDVQDSLKETIDQYCKNLSEDEAMDLIESICTVVSNYLCDRKNMYLEEEGFSPPQDFWCSNWE